MKIGILSFRSVKRRSSKEELRLKQAAKALGVKAQIFRVDRCQLIYDDRGERVYYNQKSFPKIDVLIPRASVLANADIRLAVLRQFELMNIPVINDFQSILLAKNKLRSYQMLHQHGIRIPKTVVIKNHEALNKAIDMVGGTPAIIKDPFGTFGNGVVIIESKRAARSVLDAIWKWTPREIMIQEYIGESGGRDTRVYIVDGKVVGAMERSAQAEEFRSNMELGGEAKPVKITAEYKKIAIDATKILGLEVSGVDIIETKNGPAILEVNANAGFKALEAITGVDVATQIVEYAIRKAKAQYA